MISVLVIPLISTVAHVGAEFSDFDIELAVLYRGQYRTFAKSALTSSQSLLLESHEGFVDYIVFRAKKYERFQVTINAKHVNPTNSGYRLFVTGTGFFEGKDQNQTDADAFNHLNVKGAFQQKRW